MFATREANAGQKDIENELCGNKKLNIEGDPKKREAWALSRMCKHTSALSN